MNVLIAGHTGVLGKFLSSSLDEVSINYIVSKKNPSKKIDLSNLTAVKKFVKNSKKYDVLLFLVGLAHSKGLNKSFNDFFNTNFKTLKNLLNSFEKYEKIPHKIIFTSTISVYGEDFSKRSFLENIISLKPNNPYAKTKLEAERFLTKNYLNRAWILRLAPVYSPDFMLNINKRTKFGKIPYKIGNSKNKLSLCNVKNVKIAITSILDGTLPYGIYNVSDPIIYSFEDLHKFCNTKVYLPIPSFIVKLVYIISKFCNNDFLIENGIKLLTDNIYPAKKISIYQRMENSLFDENVR